MKTVVFLVKRCLTEFVMTQRQPQMDVERHQSPVLQTLWYIRLFNHTLGTFEMFANHKGQVIRAAFLFNLSRNIVALQVERVVARITTTCSTCLATNFSVASCSNMLHKVEPSSTFCNNFSQLATLKFVARQVEHPTVWVEPYYIYGCSVYYIYGKWIYYICG